MFQRKTTTNRNKTERTNKQIPMVTTEQHLKLSDQEINNNKDKINFQYLENELKT